MIQHSKFNNGGFVLHKIPVNGQTYSAWYDKDGKLLDAERTTNHKVSHVSVKYTQVRAELQKVGNRYK